MSYGVCVVRVAVTTTGASFGASCAATPPASARRTAPARGRRWGDVMRGPCGRYGNDAKESVFFISRRGPVLIRALPVGADSSAIPRQRANLPQEPIAAE